MVSEECAQNGFPYLFREEALELAIVDRREDFAGKARYEAANSDQVRFITAGKPLHARPAVAMTFGQSRLRRGMRGVARAAVAAAAV